jgi:hypothetical protein
MTGNAAGGRHVVPYRSAYSDNARWDGFPFRDGDIVICTPVKSGTTLLQMMCGLLVFGSAEFQDHLSRISPWLDFLHQGQESVRAALEAQPHRRFIKTHTPLDGLPFDERVTYLCTARDLRDVALSVRHHMANLDLDAVDRIRVAESEARPQDGTAEDRRTLTLPQSEREFVQRWLDDPAPIPDSMHSLDFILHHVRTSWSARARPNVFLLHFEDLTGNRGEAMRHLASCLGIDACEHRIAEWAQATSIDRMRKRADRLAPNSDSGVWHDNRRFFRCGTSGQWQSVFTEEHLHAYATRVTQLIDPDLSAWLHRVSVT